MPPSCENFTINASETEIKQGDRVTLTAQGCSGQLAWNNGLGSEPSISIFPNTTTSFTATCTTGSFFCQRTVTIKVMCKIVLKITPIYEGSFWGLLADKKVKVEAICNNSPLLLNGEKVEGGNFSAKIFDGKNDLTIVASCGEGENACTETVQVKAVTRACRNFKVSGIEDGTTLTLNAAGCSEGNSVTWDNGMSGGTITIPLPEKYTVFKAVCGRNGCENYYTYERKNTNELFHIQQKPGPGDGYPVTLWPVNCKGTVSWESTPTSSLKTDVNKNLIIDSAPAYTTVYTATCTTKDHQVAQRSFTIERPLLCLSVNAPQSVAKGQTAVLTAIGCLGTVTWKSSTNTTGIGLSPEGWEKSMIPLGTGQVLTDLPLVNTIYVASCDNPGCLARHIVQIEPCSFTLKATKTTLKAGEETILSAQGCPNGTVLWQDAEGILLGWGNQVSLHPVKNKTIKAICDISKCESTLLINVPSGKPDPIICESLTLSAEPNRPIFRGESNTVTLTALGCTGGIVTWNGPLLTPDTQTSYPNHTVTIAGLQDAAAYSATCTKTALPPTQAGIDIKAEVRFTLKASPEAVEAGKTAVLTAEGCMGGIMAWKNPAAPCAGSPCTITGPVITAPATFEASCVINGQTITKRVNVSLKNSYGSVVYQQVCSSFWASYSAPPQAPYPLSSGLKITFQQGGCEQGTVKWNAQDAEGNIRSLTALEDRPVSSTTYTASCETNGAICAQKQFLVEVHQASCQDFEVSIAPLSSLGQLGGAENGKISFIAEYNGKFLITATGCVSKDKPGFEQLSVAYYPIAGSPPQSVLNNGSFYAQLNSKVEISCIANPITYPNEVCKYTLYFERTGIRRENNSNARIGDIANAETTQTPNTGNAAAASGCTAVLPLKNLMADYFATLLCANINAFYDEYGQFSAEKTATFLTAAETGIKQQPVFQSYTLTFPSDYTSIINRLKEVGTSCANIAGIAESITAGFQGSETVDVFNDIARTNYNITENTARESINPNYVFLTPDLQPFVLTNASNNATYSLIHCTSVPAVPAGTVPGFKVNEVDYCAVFDPATGFYSYRKEGLLTAPAATDLALTGAFTAKTKVILVWGLGNCPVNGKKAIVNADLVNGKTKEQIAALIDAGLPNTEDIKCGIETIEKPRLPMTPAQGSYLAWLMSNPPLEDFQRQAASLGSIRVNIFYTHQNTTTAKRAEVSKLANSPLPNEINLWVDLSGGEYKYEFFYGSDVNLTTADRTNLAFIFNKWESIYTRPNYSTMPQFLPFTVLFEALGQGINQVAKLPERFWDCQNSDYFLKDLNLTAQEKLNVALIAGLWDGVVDNVAGIPSFIAAMMDQNKRPQLLAAIAGLRNSSTWSKLYAGIEQDFADPNACKVNHTAGFWIVAAADVATGVYGVGRMASKADVIANLTKLVGNPQELFLTLGYHASHVTRGSTRVLGGLVEIAEDLGTWTIKNASANIQWAIGTTKNFFGKSYELATDASTFIVRSGDGNILRATELLRDADNILVRIQETGDEILAVIKNVLKTQAELEAIYDAIKNEPFDSSPGTDQHKAQRWAQYKESDGQYTFDRWSKQYEVNMLQARKAHVKVGEYFTSKGYVCPTICKEVSIPVNGKTRRLDIADDRPGVQYGVEFKSYESGKVYATQDIRNEILLDKELVDLGWKIEWVFKDCELSNPLEELLQDAGIKIIKI